MRVPRHHATPFLWGAIVVAAVVVAASSLEIRNPRGLWTMHPLLPEQELWEEAQEQFGEREVLTVTVQLPRDSREITDSIAIGLEEWLRAQPEVEETLGLGLARELERRLGPYADELTEVMRNAVLRTEVGVALCYVVLVPPVRAGGLEENAALLDRLERLGPPVIPSGARVYAAGQPAVDVALERILSRDLRRTVPIAMIVMGLLMVVLVGRYSGAALATVFSALAALLAGMALLDVPVSTATAVALPLTVVVGISYSLHVALAISRHGNRRTALSEIRTPLVWAFVTTVLALASFTLSPLRALRLFSVASCVGLTIAFTASLTLTPFLLPGRPPGIVTRTRRRLVRAAIRTHGSFVRWPGVSVFVLLAIGAILLLGAIRVSVEPNSYLSFFPRGHPIAEAHELADSTFGGSVQLQVLARADSGVAFRDPYVRWQLEEFVWEAQHGTAVASVLLPPSEQLLTRGRGGASVERWFVGKDTRYTRALMSAPILPTDEARLMMEQLNGIADSLSDDDVTLTVTGLLPASLGMQDLLIRLMLRSLGLLALFVVVALIATLRSFVGGLVLLVPNLLAAAAVLAGMGFVGIPIDFTTISVISLVLGVAVDDTLQIASAGRLEAGRGFSAIRALRRTSAPVVLGSLVMILGASVLATSPFGPTARLGALLALGLAVALLADLTMTPVLISWWLGRGKRS